MVGDKPFFHGAAPASVDCAIFGHLAQFLYIDIGFPQKERSQSKLSTYISHYCHIKLSILLRSSF
jgi:hypothetical protein